MKKLYHILLMVVGILLIVNVILTLLLLSRLAVECPAKAKSLPCESVPLNWAVTHYDCANSLFLSMNVTNVKFGPDNKTDTLLKKVSSRLLNRSYSD